jgi:hypothetical protein
LSTQPSLAFSIEDSGNLPLHFRLTHASNFHPTFSIQTRDSVTMLFSHAVFATGVILAPFVNAHIAITTPTPYGNPDTSPLNPSGSNYPCKTDNGFGINNITQMTVGQPQTLAFKGTAVHNGGSCQLSVTPGFQPNTNSAFKVFYTIEGGCPGLNGQTNTYQFSVPEDVPSGNYSLAWTWYNNIGNREIYMNCAPVVITNSGNKGTQQTLDALPDMAIFNIPSKNSCGTVETFDVQYPDPGNYVTTGSTYKPTPPSNCGVKAVSSGGAGGSSAGGSAPSSANNGGGSPGSSVGGSPAAPQSPTATSYLTETATSTVAVSPSGGVFGEGPSNGTGSSPSMSILVSAGSAATAAPAAPAGSNVPAGISSVQTCSTNGALQCSPDGSLQGLCNFGQAMMMPVAAGTKCVNGQIMKRSAKMIVGF